MPNTRIKYNFPYNYTRDITMAETIAMTRKWGNSIGIVLPAKIVKEEKIKPKEKVVVTVKRVLPLKDLFGLVKFKQSAQQIKDEMREGWGD